MAGDPVTELQVQLIEDAALLAEFKRDPTAVLQAHGIDVTAEMRTRVIEWNPGSLSDDALKSVLETDGLAAHL